MMKVDNQKILFINIKIQDFNTDTCRLNCIIILVLFNNKIQFYDIMIACVYYL